MSSAWVTLTVSNGPLLDEITAALRDAGIELRLSSTETNRPQTGVRTRFGERHADDKWIEVQESELERAVVVVDAIFRDAEEAAYRAAGGGPPSAAERAEEEAWRAEQLDKRRRSDRRWLRLLQLTILAIVVAIAYAALKG